MARFVNFFNSLVNSPSLEVQMMARMVRTDARSTTARNLHLIQKESGLDSTNFTANDVKSSVPRRPVPENQLWRISLLPKYLVQRKEMENNFLNTSYIGTSIDSLCSSWFDLLSGHLLQRKIYLVHGVNSTRHPSPPFLFRWTTTYVFMFEI